MSMGAIRWAFEQNEKAGAKSVLIALAWHADKKGWNAHPSVKTLSAETGLDERSVGRHLEGLVKRGRITRERRHAKGGPRRGERIPDGFQLRPRRDGQADNMSGSQPDNLSACELPPKKGTNRQFDRDYPTNLQGPTDNLSAAYIDEPTIEPSKGTQSVGALPCNTTSKKSAKVPKKKRPSSENTVPDGWPDVMAQAEAVNYWDGVGRHDLSAHVAEIAENAHDWHDAKQTTYARWDAVWRQWFRREATRPRSSAAPARNRQPTAQEVVAAWREDPRWPKSH